MSTHKQKFEIPPSPNLDFENALCIKRTIPIAGLDEAGRGAWAGPVYAAAVILHVDTQIQNQLQGVRDSKQMSAKQRDYWAEKIKNLALAWGIGSADHIEIDQIGIIASTRLAMSRAIDQLTSTPQHLLIDALRLPAMSIEQTAIIKGDQRSLSIAAASILAKTARDAWMRTIAEQHPDYGFAQHKGYGTRLHQAKLIELGPSPIHRTSFRPIKAIIT
ncbi:MAG: ribonuclease HII [Anaerolineaceae bacterium]